MRKYLKVFVLGLQNALEYRMNFLMSLTSCIFPILIQYFMWVSIFNQNQQSQVLGYKFDQLIMYAIFASILAKLVGTGFENEVASDVKTGQLSKFIVQPIGYFQHRISSFVGGKIPQMVIVLLILFGIMVFVHFVMHMETEITMAGIALFLVVILFAILLNFFISYCLSTLSFWFLEVWGIFFTFRLIGTLVSGGVFPLDLFGETVLRILDFLPFKFIIYFPIHVLTGKLTWDQVGYGVLMQLAWIFSLFLLSRWLWNKGMKRFESAGG